MGGEERSEEERDEVGQQVSPADRVGSGDVGKFGMGPVT